MKQYLSRTRMLEQHSSGTTNVTLSNGSFVRNRLFLMILVIQCVFATVLYAEIPLFKLQATRDQAIPLSYSGSSADTSGMIQLPVLTDVSGFAVHGTIRLTSDTAYARLILVDSMMNEYLIYETDTLLSPEKVMILDGVCDETGYLDDIDPLHIRLESEHAAITITGAEVVFMAPAPLAAARAQIKKDKLNEKISRINAQLKKNKKKWIAGETAVSERSYAEKKTLFGGTLPNLHGFEYYKGGIFEIPVTDGTGRDVENTTETPRASPYVDEFTWLNRHGKNWVTPTKNQGGCGSCWSFANTGATELLVNLYYNRQLNVNLAEQDALSCSGYGDCGGGYTHDALEYYKNTGIVNESCFPYQVSDEPCSSRCSQPDERIQIGGTVNYNDNSEDPLKRIIINSPVSFIVRSWSHAIGLVGYKTLKVGDQLTIYYSDGSNAPSPQTVTINTGDSLVGKTAWSIKNSWGASWGDGGIGYIVTPRSNIAAKGLTGPVQSLNYSDSYIACVDNDNDGYYSWGIGDKPATCPASSPDDADGDDSDGAFGPMDEYGHLMPLNTATIVSPLDNSYISDLSAVTIEASVTADSNTVDKVVFFQNNQLLGEDTSFPYSQVWTNVPHGRHELTATVHFSSGTQRTSAPVTFTATPPLGDGSISHMVWMGEDFNTITKLTSHVDFPDVPNDVSATIDRFKIPSGYGDNYGTRVVGYLHPPATGDYTLAIAGDDDCELWLSTDESSDNKERIAYISGYANQGEWNKYPSQTSRTIRLTVGNIYYIEALHVERAGEDHLAVGWTIPGATFAVIEGQFLSPVDNQPKLHFVTYTAETGGQFIDTNGLRMKEIVQKIPTGQDAAPVKAISDDTMGNEPYYFSRWIGDVDSTDSTLTITDVRKDMSVTALFDNRRYSVEFIAGTNGSISGETNQTVVHGSSTSSVTAVPSPGYRFSGWTGDYTGTNETISLDNVTSAMTVTATFEPESHTVRFLTETGGVLTGETVQNVPHNGDCSQVSVSALTGYTFTGWTGDATSQDQDITLTNITQDMTVTAGFDLNTYTVTFIAGTNGSITGTLVQQVSHGADATQVTAIADSGFFFQGWKGDYNGTESVLQVRSVTSDMTIRADFGANTHTVTFVCGTGGTLTGTTIQTIAHGANTTAVTAVPDSGMHFTGWTGSVTSTLETIAPFQVTGDMTITANFDFNTYTVTFQDGENGRLDGTTTQTVKHGDSTSAVTAIPDASYVFDKWAGDYNGRTAYLILKNVTRDMTLKPVFKTEDEVPGCFIQSIQ